MRVFWTVLLFYTFSNVSACGSADQNVSSEQHCLESYGYQYDQILSKEDVIRHIDIGDVPLKSISPGILGPHGYVRHSWESQRSAFELEIQGVRIRHPDVNMVQLSNLIFYPDQRVDVHRGITLVQMFDIKHLTQNERSSNGDGDSIGNYRPVGALGDRAYWAWDERGGIDLHVLDGSVSFQIDVKVSDQLRDNLMLAKQLAESILTKCP